MKGEALQVSEMITILNYEETTPKPQASKIEKSKKRSRIWEKQGIWSIGRHCTNKKA